MKLMVIMTITAAMMSMIMIMMSTIISKKTITDREKTTPFECGFNPLTHSRLPFSIQFFLISMLFLIFDIEIALILPLIPMMKISMMKMWWITASMFITILLVGLYYEWKQGMLKWAS
uniref:NADH-ubiquinone oxidoreductase chain 3 n=1 Tax=Trachytettix bufo TaxID=1260748 RepID=M4JCH3_9ORTH|nr:NADH dehydrogenase subunit 3 [Trachytettix bufo]